MKIQLMQYLILIKNKKYTIISIDAQKTFDEIQHPFMIRTLNNLGIQGNFLTW